MTDPHTADDPRALVGHWELRRHLEDRRSQLRGELRGRLVVTPSGAGLAWTETGTLTWDGRQRPAGRELLVVPGDDGWAVCFSDGRHFHPWRLDGPVRHACGADTYVGVYRRPAADVLHVTWEVRGPSKDVSITTTLERLPAPVDGGGSRSSGRRGDQSGGLREGLDAGGRSCPCEQ